MSTPPHHITSHIRSRHITSHLTKPHHNITSVTFPGTRKIWCEVGLSLFRAGATFRDAVIASLFLAGATLGDVGMSLLVAGAAVADADLQLLGDSWSTI